MRRGKYENVRTPVVSVAIYLAVVLFWLVAITIYLSTGLFAKYSTTAIGSDSARVIKFGDLIVTENGVANSQGKQFVFQPGADLEKKVTVEFEGSEAATFVIVSVETPGWTKIADRDFVLNQGETQIMSWSVDEKWTYLTSENEGDLHVYYVALDPNEAMQIVDAQGVTSGWDFVKDGKITVSADATRADYKNLAGAEIAINLKAYAVQANGFYTEGESNPALAAWNSINK